MRQSRGACQRQPGYNGKDGGEGNCGDEAEEEVTADGVRQIDRRHAAAALESEDVLGDIDHILRVVGNENDGAETDDEGQDVEDSR